MGIPVRGGVIGNEEAPTSGRGFPWTIGRCLHHALVEHGVGDLHEAGDVGLEEAAVRLLARASSHACERFGLTSCSISINELVKRNILTHR